MKKIGLSQKRMCIGMITARLRVGPEKNPHYLIAFFLIFKKKIAQHLAFLPKVSETNFFLWPKDVMYTAPKQRFPNRSKHVCVTLHFSDAVTFALLL